MWTFLDKLNLNLLYEYAEVMTGSKTYIDFHTLDDEERKKKAYYLIYFVYRYVLQLNTLDEALRYANEDTLKKYRLYRFIDHRYLYVGIDETKRPFSKPRDISIILEILYNRYDFWEQLDCFCRNTRGKRQKQCLDAIEIYKTMYGRLSNDRKEIT